MRWGAIIEYDGSDFFGSQLQEAEYRTVQQELERSLSVIASASVRVHFASRTDRGVHAYGQVVAFDLSMKLSAAELKSALNYNLPRDIAVRHAQRVQTDFDPRRDASSRTYVYRIHSSPTPTAIGRRYTAHIREPLSVARMQTLAQHFVGEHDFAAFAGPATPREHSTVRTITEVAVTQREQCVSIRITGSSFLHQQIRRMVRLLVAGAIERTTESELVRYVNHGTRDAPWSNMLPANGLFLDKILYNLGETDLESRLPRLV